MDIKALIAEQATSAGVDPDLALAIARAESNLRPGAKNPKSSAAGLFQVTDATWKQYGGAPGKKLDPRENTRVGMAIIKDNYETLRGVLDRDPRPSEVYAAHFFGKTGVKPILSADPNTPVEQLVSPKVVKANPGMLKGKTVEQVLAGFGKKVGDDAVAVASSQTAVPTPYVAPAAAPGQYREDPASPPIISQAPAQPAAQPAAPTLTTAAARTADLGAGYQAALALSYLADTEESEKDDEGSPSIVEKQIASSAPVSAGKAAQMLAQMDWGYAPVVQGEQQPVRMAEGGLLQQAAGAGARFRPSYLSKLSSDSGWGSQAEYDNYLAMARKDHANRQLALEMAAARGFFAEGGEVDAPAEMKPTPQNPVLGKAAEALRALQRAGNIVYLTGQDPQESGLGTALFGGPASELENWSYGNAPMQVPPMSNVPQFKQGRAQTMADTLLLGADVASLGATAPVRGVVRGIEAGAMRAGRAAEAALEAPVRSAMERGGKAAEMLQAMSPAPAYAVRPPGGNVAEKGVNELLRSINVSAKLSELPADRRDAVQEFLETKGRAYFQKDYASTKDPLYQALKDGRIKPLSSSRQLREYVIAAAREGNPEAAEDLARAYDRGMEAKLLRPEFQGDINARVRREMALVEQANQQLLGAPGSALPEERQLLSVYTDVTPVESFERLQMGRPLSEGEQMAVQRGSPFYKIQEYQVPDFLAPQNLVDSLAEIPPEKLKKMSYPEAVIEVNQKARFRADWQAAVDRVMEGKDVPKEVALFGTKPLEKAGTGTWVRLTDPRATEMESAMLGHSVRGYMSDQPYLGTRPYGHGGRSGFESGLAQIFSLRDAKGRARVTVEAKRLEDGKLAITQIKGPQNGDPRQAGVPSEDIYALFNKLDKDKGIALIKEESYRMPDESRQRVDWQAGWDMFKMQNPPK